jgi:hypothetical protein
MQSSAVSIHAPALGSSDESDPRPVGISRRASILIIVGVVVATMLPMALMGIPDGYDLTQHMRFATSYYDAILSGEIVPRWAAKDNFGFGSIGIRYYPPVAYVVLAGVRTVVGGWYHAFWITALGWALTGSLGVYVWAKEWGTNTAATIAAVVYMIIPYHTFQIYQAVLYAEFAAAGILPFCFLYLTRLLKKRRWEDAILFAISYSLLILTHIPTTILATAAMGIYGVLVIDWKQFGNTVWKGGTAVALSLAATSFHLVKVVMEVDWVKHSSPKYYSTGFYDYGNYLFPLSYSADRQQFPQLMTLSYDVIVSLTILFIAFALVAYWAPRRLPLQHDFHLKSYRALLITSGISLFMLSLASLWIWRSLPILQKVQFPTRWLAVISVLASVLFGIAAVRMFQDERLKRFAVYSAAIFLLLVGSYDISQNVLPSAPLSQSKFDTKVAEMYDEAGCICWWPIWAGESVPENRDRVSVVGRLVTITVWEDTERRFSVTDGEASTARIATFYHPYWHASASGAPLPISAGDDGTIDVELPAEEADLTLKFEEPPSNALFRWLSMLVWVGFAISTALIALKRRHRYL